MARRAFCYAICGDNQAARINLSLQYLKKYTRHEIVVVKCRVSERIDHDQVVDVPIDHAIDDRRGGILLKTHLHRILAERKVVRCYLDSDVVAVNRSVDEIFDAFEASSMPIAFGRDHCNIAAFSPHAVHCGCQGSCNHLIDAVRNTFGVVIAHATWRHWNGGVFVFDESSRPFMDCWHEFTRRILTDPYWKARDQGTLAAAAWSKGVQAAPVLPPMFNTIVDCFKGIAEPLRDVTPVEHLTINSWYKLRGDSGRTPAFLHFVNGGAGRRGWQNWDDVETLFAAEELDSNACETETVSLPRLSDDNRIVHGLWIGSCLSKLELLTMRSFLKQGHEFHLWLYDRLETPIPKEVVLEDASTILPRTAIFRRTSVDPESGVGKNSLGLFSDLFRYKVLYERGGYWTDMDVTCLRPLNFSEEYVFRSHRVGIVGNIMKCPRGSPVMRETFERVARQASSESPWLMSNRVLSEVVERSGLSGCIRPNLCNRDDWADVRQLLEEDSSLPSDWYVIHWMNEVWRTLEVTGGLLRGRLVGEVPNRERPGTGTTLMRLYEEHGLAEIEMAPRFKGLSSCSSPTVGEADLETTKVSLLAAVGRQPISPTFVADRHLNVFVPSLTLGGAERIVMESLQGLGNMATVKLFVYRQASPCFDCSGLSNTQVIRLYEHHADDRLRVLALEVLSSGSAVLFTHMIKAQDLRVLWDYGVQTIPVVHNSQPSWQDPPSAFNHAHVPFVIAVSDHVAAQLRAHGCPCPVITVRHELQRWRSVDELEKNRAAIRDQYGIADDTLLIGMVGEFKAQKAYTRAVRVLAAVQQEQAAKLMILGGWDHEWGHGRAAYTATCRQALDLNVVADVLTPGRVQNTEVYYPAFDVFLNTSVYEGLSIATLEAAQFGCPIVTADAGGNAESLPPQAVVVSDTSQIDAYVDGIERALDRNSRLVPQRPSDADLIPRLWYFLSEYGADDSRCESRAEDLVVFLTDNLNVGGAPQSLVTLLTARQSETRPWLGVMNASNHQAHLDKLAAAAVRSLRSGAQGYLDRTERCLHMIRRLRARIIVFWNLDARIKLLLAKVLSPSSVRLVDVSPGALMFDELNARTEFQRRIAFTQAQYYERLDRFVAKFEGGGPADGLLAKEKLTIIRNGVPDPVRTSQRDLRKLLPPGADPELVIGTSCRIVPDKRLEFLVAMMAELNLKLSGVHLVIVGGLHPAHQSYWEAVQAYRSRRGVTNIIFAGHQQDVVPYLSCFKLFVMVSDRQGCPNASLEAMTLGLPIVANANGGTAEQIVHGFNGFLVSDEDPADMAQQVLYLLTNKQVRKQFGEASRCLVQERFSMTQMVRGYTDLFASFDTEVRPAMQERVPCSCQCAG